jgi:oligogalacturonide lyase
VNPSRRLFVSLWPAALGYGFDKTAALPSEVVRYADPATEFPIFRLTDPKNTSLLPAYYGRAVSRRGNFILYSNDRSGIFQAYRMEVKSGQSHQLTSVTSLQTDSLTLMPDERSFCCVADGAVVQIGFANGKDRQLYRLPEEWAPGKGFSVSDDGLYALLVEVRKPKWRLRLVNLVRGTAVTVLEAADEISDPSPRPRRAGILYQAGGREMHVVNYDGAQNQRLHAAPGALGPALWSADGRAVDYLNFPEDRKQLNNLREYTADANEDRLVAPTTQFVHFGRNADSTVFVGASGSKASPYLLLLVRAVKRELTLCEHKASDARMVAPVFSPNSQRVFFQTDRHGKWAIYSVAVDRLVEETE